MRLLAPKAPLLLWTPRCVGKFPGVGYLLRSYITEQQLASVDPINNQPNPSHTLYPSIFGGFLNLSRFSAAISILFGGKLSEDDARELGYVKPTVVKPAAPVKEVKASDGAQQLLGILQRDARLVDFLMEDITAYSDDQVGGAVRGIHEQSATALKRYFQLAPVIDGVEGTNTSAASAGTLAQDGVKFLGNVPAKGKPTSGTLRHKGWKIEKINLPAIPGGQNLSVLAQAEIEIE